MMLLSKKHKLKNQSDIFSQLSALSFGSDVPAKATTPVKATLPTSSNISCDDDDDQARNLLATLSVGPITSKNRAHFFSNSEQPSIAAKSSFQEKETLQGAEASTVQLISSPTKREHIGLFNSNLSSSLFPEPKSPSDEDEREITNQLTSLSIY